MKRESFIFYQSFYEAIKELPKDIHADIYAAIMEYSLYGVEMEIENPIIRSIFRLMKPQIDANNVRYENGCKGASSGKLGGRPKTVKETPTEPLNNPKQTPNENVNENLNYNVNYNENENAKENENTEKTPSSFLNNSFVEIIEEEQERQTAIVSSNTSFIIPTLQQVENYCRERNSTISAQNFYNYYQSNGWRIGQNPMNNWQAAIQNWETKSFGKPLIPPPKSKFDQNMEAGEGAAEFAKKLLGLK